MDKIKLILDIPGPALAWVTTSEDMEYDETDEWEDA